MQKMVALVVLRTLRSTGKDFRLWFARSVVAITRNTQYRDAQLWHALECTPNVAHYARMSQLRVAMSNGVARYNYRQNYVQHQKLKRNIWFNYWGWHERAMLPPKSQKRF